MCKIVVLKIKLKLGNKVANMQWFECYVQEHDKI